MVKAQHLFSALAGWYMTIVAVDLDLNFAMTPFMFGVDIGPPLP